MPYSDAMRRGDGEDAVRDGRGCWDGVWVARTIAAKNHEPDLEVLDRKTKRIKRIKLDGTSVVTSKLANRKKIMHYRWDN